VGALLGNLDAGALKRRSAKDSNGFVGKAVSLQRHPEQPLVELSIVVLVMKGNDSVISRGQSLENARCLTFFDGFLGALASSMKSSVSRQIVR